MARSRLDSPLEMLQLAGPAALDVLAHLLAGLGAHLLELAVLELDAGRVRSLGDEAHLDLGAHIRVRLPIAVDVPAHHETVRRFPDPELSPAAARAAPPPP